MKKIILASASPRRRELLQGMGLDFTVDTENTFEEIFDEGTPHEKVPEMMSRGKSHGFHRPLSEDELLVTADTMVLLEKRILGKPHSREEAFNMLKALSGHTHEVITAVTMRDSRKEKTFSVSTKVTFEAVTDEDILKYIDTYRPFDKAGAYGVQEWIGHIGISGIEGSFYNVMGFPTQRFYRELMSW